MLKPVTFFFCLTTGFLTKIFFTHLCITVVYKKITFLTKNFAIAQVFITSKILFNRNTKVPF